MKKIKDKKFIFSKPLIYADIQKGMKVIDNDGDEGKVVECNDAHNIIVNYKNGGKGIHCLVEGCEYFGRSLLYVCV